MKVIQTEIPGVLILEPTAYRDERGFFLESYNKKELQEIGITAEFVQDNYSHSKRNVLRGLHYQIQQPQGKLIRVIAGEIYDVAVDIRKSSPAFGKWVGMTLAAAHPKMLWIPAGFAHGFLVLSDRADVLYKATDYYAPDFERTVLWNDPQLDINWPLRGEAAVLSEKDRAGRLLQEADLPM